MISKIFQRNRKVFVVIAHVQSVKWNHKKGAPHGAKGKPK